MQKRPPSKPLSTFVELPRRRGSPRAPAGAPRAARGLWKPALNPRPQARSRAPAPGHPAGGRAGPARCLPLTAAGPGRGGGGPAPSPRSSRGVTKATGAGQSRPSVPSGRAGPPCRAVPPRWCWRCWPCPAAPPPAVPPWGCAAPAETRPAWAPAGGLTAPTGPATATRRASTPSTAATTMPGPAQVSVAPGAPLPVLFQGVPHRARLRYGCGDGERGCGVAEPGSFAPHQGLEVPRCHGLGAS